MGGCFVTTQQAIDTANEIIRENRENGELEGVLNRYRVAALNRVIRLAEVATIESGTPSLKE